MKVLIQAAAVTLFAASTVHAQQAVQWRVQAGGNGHCYRLVRDPVPQPISWTSARDLAAAQGGTLACVGSTQESDFIWSLVPPIADPAWGPFGPRSCGPFLGGFRTPGPHGSDADGWAWVDGSAWKHARWAPTEPANGGGVQDYLKYWFDPSSPLPEWGDDNVDSSDAFIVEWSADCNNDGIVDKGQILRGQLQDADSDGVPDVCQQPTCRDADFFPDRNVNGVDLGVLLSQWGAPTQYTVADLSRDGAVDGIDLGLFLSFWGPCPC